MPKLHVFDTYATAKSGRILHFDIVIPEQDQALALRIGKEWLAGIGEADATLKSHSCNFCHTVETHKELEREVSLRGYAIIALEGCPA